MIMMQRNCKGVGGGMVDVVVGGERRRRNR
jgi:hypothetical protein